MKLIKGGCVFAPDNIGNKDILIAGDRILKMADKITPPEGLDVEIIDAQGKSVTPGLIDGHLHINGGGGGNGHVSRSVPTSLSKITTAGVTTCISFMGSDHIGYSLEGLLAVANSLEKQGITVYILSGSFVLPSITITGSLVKDLYVIDKVLGVKIALWETICSHPDEATLIKTFSDVHLGSRLGNKAGIIVSHIGDISCRPADIADLLDKIGMPLKSFVMAHINRNPELLQKSIECGKRGINLDLTATIPNWTKIQPSKALRILLDGGVPIENITLSSDGNGTARNIHGDLFVLSIDECFHEIQDMVKTEGFSLTDALKTMTTNPANIYHLNQKGSIAEGKDADILLLDNELNIDTVIARGQIMVQGKKTLVKGVYE